jgi:hypothetical protein
MKKNKLIIFVLTPVLFIFSILVIYNNQGLYYSEYKESFEIELYGGGKDAMLEAVEEVNKLSGIVYTDAIRGRVPTFQNVSIDSVQTKYNDILNNIEDAPSYNIREFFPDRDLDDLGSLIMFFVLAPFISLLVFFGIYIWKNQHINKFSSFLRLTTLIIFGSYLNLIFILGLLSFASTFIMIKEIHLISLAVGFVSFIVVVSMSIRKILTQEISFKKLVAPLWGITTYLNEKIYFILLAYILVIIALGQNFVWTGLFSVASVITTLLVVRYLSVLFDIDKDKISIIKNHISILNSQRNISAPNVNDSNLIEKNHTNLKKKKKLSNEKKKRNNRI